MRFVGIAFVLALTLPASARAQEPAPSFFDLDSRSLAGEELSLEAFRGQVCLVVNVASKCGLTPQYEGLQALHEKYRERGFSVLAFPSNDFKNQEPGTPAEIAEFCSSRYGVTFPMFEKVRVIGEEKGEIYRFLTADHEEPTWNFTKFLISQDGAVLHRFAPRTAPDDPELLARIEEALEP